LLKGLFEYLWADAGLLNWEPDNKRLKYQDIRHIITDNLNNNTSCNNQILRNILFIPYWEKWLTFKDILIKKSLFTSETGAKRRIIILGLLNTFKATPYGKMLKLYTIHEHTVFFINKPSTIKRLNKALPLVDGSYSFGQNKEGFYWFIGTAFPQLKQDKSGITYIIDEGIIIPVSNEHVPLNNN